MSTTKKDIFKKSGKDVASFLAFWWGIWIYQQKKKRQTWLWPSFPPWQVAERTLFLWNNDYIVRLITSSRKVAADRTTDRTAPKWWFEWKIRWGVSWNEAIPTSVISLHYVLDRFGIYIYNRCFIWTVHLNHFESTWYQHLHKCMYL